MFNISPGVFGSNGEHLPQWYILDTALCLFGLYLTSESHEVVLAMTPGVKQHPGVRRDVNTCVAVTETNQKHLTSNHNLLEEKYNLLKNRYLTCNVYYTYYVFSKSNIIKFIHVLLLMFRFEQGILSTKTISNDLQKQKKC